MRRRPTRKRWPEEVDEPFDPVLRWLQHGEQLEPKVLPSDFVTMELLDVNFTDDSPENRQVVADFLTKHGTGLGAALYEVQGVARMIDRHLSDPKKVTESEWRAAVAILNRFLPWSTFRLTMIGDEDDSKVPLHVAVAVQIWNQIVEGRMYVQCANPKCAKQFTKQRGNPETARPASGLSGLKWCSPRCGNAVRQREWRERQRAEAKKSTTKKGKKQ